MPTPFASNIEKLIPFFGFALLMFSTVDFFYYRKNTAKGKVRIRKRIDLILSYLWFAE